MGLFSSCMRCNKIQIHIRKQFPNETITLRMRGKDTVEDIKRMISRSEGLPTSRQQLLYNGQRQKDWERLKDANISHGSRLHLVIRFVSSMTIHIETHTGRSTTFIVESDETVARLKERIARALGVPTPSQQYLSYHGERLKDGCSLHDHGVGDGSCLKLVLFDQCTDLDIDTTPLLQQTNSLD